MKSEGLAFSEFKGYETWQVVSLSHSDETLNVIVANPAMIDAYVINAIEPVISMPDRLLGRDSRLATTGQIRILTVRTTMAVPTSSNTHQSWFSSCWFRSAPSFKRGYRVQRKRPVRAS